MKFNIPSAVCRSLSRIAQPHPASSGPQTAMIKPTNQEIKRTVDSKIFELQSSLLEDGVTEDLLRECAVWFRPSHLQDIVIERSDAEGTCGWPGCGNSLPSWRRAAPIVFDLSDGEQLGRFCDRACMAKTKVFLATIPSTPPYSRGTVLRLAFPTSPAGSGLADRASSEPADRAGTNGPKKVYKRARRIDTPAHPAAARADSAEPGKSKTGEATSTATADATTSTAASVVVGETEEVEGALESEVGTAGIPSQQGGPGDGSAGPVVSIAEETEGREELKRAGDDGPRGGQVDGCGEPPLDGKSEDVRVTELAAAGDKAAEEASHGGGDAGDDDAAVDVVVAQDDLVEDVQARMGQVCISEQTRCSPPGVSSSASATTGPTTTVVSSARSLEAETTISLPVAASAPSPAPAFAGDSSPWENVRLNRQTGASSVSLHATLAAAAAETAAAETAASASAAAAAAETENVAAIIPHERSISMSDVSSGRQQDGGDADDGGDTTTVAPARRRSVSFAEGTKASPPSNPAAVSGNAFVSASGSGTTTGNRGRGGAKQRRGYGLGRGRGRGRGRGKAEQPKKGATALRREVVGGVVERAPTEPMPMEVKAGGRGHGVVEGHQPSIEADLSFRVMPRGFDVAGRGGDAQPGVICGVEEAEGDAASGDAWLHGYDVGAEDEEEEEGDGVVEGENEEKGGDDADDKDRAIWLETFGEELPAEAAEGSWIDMEAVRDKETREEFASSIPAFALLWSALSEWTTPETRAVCRAGRAAAMAATTESAVAAVAAGAAASSSEDDDGVAVGVSSQSAAVNMPSPHSIPADFQSRKAGAVAEAIELQAHHWQSRGHGVLRSADGAAANSGGGLGGGGSGSGPTVTGALRHSGVSAMVNMHLAQAERALRVSAAAAAAARGSTTEGSRKWRWSETVDVARPGAARPGGWVEEHTELGLEAPTMATTLQSDFLAGGAKSVGAATRGDGKGEGLVAESRGGAEVRRAVAAVIDTLDAGRASAAASLSIAQWKVVPLVLLTALGLGGGGERGGASGGVCGDGNNKVGRGESEAGAGACAHLCGPEAILTAREFEMLVEVLLEE